MATFMNLDGINPAHVGVKRALNILQFIPKAHYPSLFWACVCSPAFVCECICAHLPPQHVLQHVWHVRCFPPLDGFTYDDFHQVVIKRCASPGKSQNTFGPFLCCYIVAFHMPLPGKYLVCCLTTDNK